MARSGGRRQQPEVFRITGARKPLSEDVRSRERKYVASMLFRVVALIAVVAVPLPVLVKVLLGAFAILIPYFAVVFANGGREPEPEAKVNAPTPYQRAIEPPRPVPDKAPPVPGETNDQAHAHG